MKRRTKLGSVRLYMALTMMAGSMLPAVIPAIVMPVRAESDGVQYCKEEKSAVYVRSAVRYGPVTDSGTFEKGAEGSFLYGKTGDGIVSEPEDIYHFVNGSKLTTVVYTGNSSLEIHEFDSGLK